MIGLMTLTTTAFVVPSLKLSSLYDSVQAKCPAITETGKHFHRDSTYSKEGSDLSSVTPLLEGNEKVTALF